MARATMRVSLAEATEATHQTGSSPTAPRQSRGQQATLKPKVRLGWALTLEPTDGSVPGAPQESRLIVTGQSL